MKNILVTGGDGFIGAPLVKRLSDSGYCVIATTRKNHKHKSLNYFRVDIDPYTDWSNYLDKVDVIIHLAGRAHVVNDSVPDLLSVYRRTNAESTLNLAMQAANHGVKRFIFLSSIKVLGGAGKDEFFNADSPYSPTEPYGVSKMEAEISLLDLAQTSSIEIIIVRPPLVYGPKVKANFMKLIKLVKSGIPLPFACATNKRSYISLDNLIDFIITCVNHKDAKNQIFMVSDDLDLSTSELIRRMREILSMRENIFFFPKYLLYILFKIIGKKSMFDRLFYSLQIDISKTKTILNWRPPFGVRESLCKTLEMDGHLD